jgi:protein SCO1/2
MPTFDKHQMGRTMKLYLILTGFLHTIRSEFVEAFVLTANPTRQFGSSVKNGARLTRVMLLACCWLPITSVAGVIDTTAQADHDVSLIRQVVTYQVPDLSMIRQDGAKQSFIKELNDGRPVVISFIFTSCSAICPMLTHTLMKVQSQLKQGNQNVHLMSVSIDPENDTPSTLSEYAKRYSSGSNWDFYTGSRDDSILLQKAFNVYRGDKMNHVSVILIRQKPSGAWVRLEGFLNADTVIRELISL